MAEEMKERYINDGLDEDIITDTIVNTGLLLKDKNEYYPVRGCAIKSILDRAGIQGNGLRRVKDRNRRTPGIPGSGGQRCRMSDFRNRRRKSHFGEGLWNGPSRTLKLIRKNILLIHPDMSGIKTSQNRKNIKGWEPVLYYGSQLDERNLPERDAVRTKCVGNRRTRR